MSEKKGASLRKRAKLHSNLAVMPSLRAKPPFFCFFPTQFPPSTLSRSDDRRQWTLLVGPLPASLPDQFRV